MWPCTLFCLFDAYIWYLILINCYTTYLFIIFRDYVTINSFIWIAFIRYFYMQFSTYLIISLLLALYFSENAKSKSNFQINEFIVGKSLIKLLIFFVCNMKMFYQMWMARWYSLSWGCKFRSFVKISRMNERKRGR